MKKFLTTVSALAVVSMFVLPTYAKPTGVPKGPAPMVDVCHHTEGVNEYILIRVNENALPAHLAHGDGQPLGAVPSMDGATFGADCSIVEPEEFTLVGDWSLSVNDGSFMHDMFILSQDQDGVLSGNGGYPESGSPYNPGFDWTLTGQLTGDQVSITISYSNGYIATITGTVAPDFSSMSGGHGTGGVVNWEATRLP